MFVCLVSTFITQRVRFYPIAVMSALSQVLQATNGSSVTHPYLSVVAGMSLAAKPLDVAVIAPSQSAAMASVAVVAAAPPAEHEYARWLVKDALRVVGGGLHPNGDWLKARENLFRAAAILQACGLHAEAAEAFQQSAAVGRVMGTHDEVLTTTAFAIENYRNAGDFQQTVSLLKEQYELHMQAGRSLSAARAARQIGELFEALGDASGNEDALYYYQLAQPLYDASKDCRGYSLQVRFKCACLRALTKRFKDSAETFELLAEQRQATSRTQCYFLSLLNLLCDTEGDRWAGGLARARKIFEQYQDKDKALQSGAEYSLLRGVLEACNAPSLAQLDAAHKRFSLLRPTDADLPFVDTMIATVRQNLFNYMKPYM